jgi:hypothetical protein
MFDASGCLRSATFPDAVLVYLIRFQRFPVTSSREIGCKPLSLRIKLIKLFPLMLLHASLWSRIFNIQIFLAETRFESTETS